MTHWFELAGRLAQLEAELNRAHIDLDQLAAECERYEAALQRIAQAESGDWGWIAHQALTEET